MIVTIAIEMDRPGKVGVGVEQSDFLLEQEGVGTEINELFARDKARSDPVDLTMEQRLAAGEHHDWGTAFLDSIEAFVDAQSLIEDRGRIVDLAAAGAGEVAAE